MRVDRTWTVCFEEHEFQILRQELERTDLPTELGWRPILRQFVNARQVTLPLRALERLSLELDMVRTQLRERQPNQSFQQYFPLLSELSTEVDALLYSGKRKSA